MTIRDIGILFGYKIDESSERKVEGSIKSLKSMASKALGAKLRRWSVFRGHEPGWWVFKN